MLEHTSWMQFIIQNAPVGISIADAQSPDTPLVYVNQGFTQITGYHAKECLGRNCRFLQSNDIHQPGRYIFRDAVKRGEACRAVLRNYRKDGSVFWNEITITPIRNEQQVITHFLGFQYDVSKDHEYNDLMVAYDVINEQLKHSEEQTEELQRVYEQLRESNAQRDQIITMLAHDLQNPIAAMMSFVEVMRDKDLQLSEEDKRMYGDVAYETAERMIPIVRRLVSVTRMAQQEHLETKFTGVNIASMVESLLSGYRYRAAGKNISLESSIEGNFIVKADETLVFEIIDNLLSNALKYTPQGKRVGVHLSQHANRICLEIWDEGPGFTNNDKEKIFHHQGMLSARPAHGEASSGIGLVAVYNMVQRLHGQVWCESEYGHGARFFVELPVWEN